MSNYPTIYTSSASPQVILGDNLTGVGSDDARQGFRKYNNHVHLPFSSTDFFTYNVAIADEVFIYDDDGLDIFETVDPPVIEYITHNSLRINLTSPVTVENKVLYVKSPLEDISNAILITGVDMAEGSNLITFNADTPRGGFLTSEQYKLLASKQINHSFNLIDGSLPAALPFVITVENLSWLAGLSLYITQGSATGYLRITRDATGAILNSDPITVTAGSITNTRFTEDEVDPGVVPFAGLLTSPLAPGDLIEFVLSSVTFPDGVTQVMLVGTLDLLRVL